MNIRVKNKGGSVREREDSDKYNANEKYSAFTS